MDNIKKSLIDAKERMDFLTEEAEDMKIGINQLAETLHESFKQLIDLSNAHYKYAKELSDNMIEIKSQFESFITKDTKQIQTGTIQIGTIQTGTSYGNSGGPQIKRDEPSSSPRKVNINETSPRKLTINAKDEHTRVIKIRAEEENDSPFLPKEDEYKNTAKIIYELQENDCYYIASGDHVYLRLIVTQGGDLVMTKMAADYRFLDLIYPGKDLKEIERFDDLLKGEISKFARGGLIYLKLYSISPEIDGRMFYPAEHIITIRHLFRNFQIEVGRNTKPVPNIIRS